MGFQEEYNKLRKKRLEEQEKKPGGMLYQNKTLPKEDIAPIYTSTKKAESQSSDDKWFKGGAFEDGYQVGDIAKTILGTGRDFADNVNAAVVDATENLIDTTAYGVGVVGGLFSKDFQDKTGDFIAKDLLQSEKTGKALSLLSPGGALAQLILGDATEENSLLSEKGDGLVQSGAHLVGSAALGAINPALAYISMGVNAFGSEIEQAYANDATHLEAGVSGTVAAGAEILFEKLSSGIKIFQGSTLDESLTQLLSQKISNKIVRTMAKWGMDVVGEGAEEVATEYATALGRKLTYADEQEWNDLLTKEDVWDAFLGGAILGGVAGGGKVVNSAVQGRDYTTGLTTDEEYVVDRVSEERIAEQEKDGVTLTNTQKNEIRKQVERDMERGYISVDDIERILGGASYDTYKNMADTETAKQAEVAKQIEELENLPNEKITVKQAEQLKSLRQELQDLKDNATSPAWKDQLSEHVFNRANGSKLAESYNERARRGTAFDADLSQYKGAQQETIKRAVESGVLNNTNRTHEFVDMVAKISADKGVLFDFTNNAKLKESGFAVDGATVNGYFDKASNTVGVNIDSAKAYDTVVGHEVTHVLEGTELYSELQKAVFEYAKTKGEYDSRRQALAKLYAEEDIDSEMTSDLVGEYLFTDEDFVKNLSVQHRNVFQKIYDEIKYLYKLATAGSKEAREIEKVKRAFDKAYREQGAKVDTKSENFYDAKTKHSLTVKDPETLDFLNNQETITTYKTMQLVDGKLYPPMAARTDGKYEDASELGVWEQATEHPELIKNGNKFKLDKGKGQGSIEAAYNPYMHSSNLVLNDQFSSAYKRDNLVTVECEVPVSEMTSGYHAEFAKDSVGWHPWHTGTVAGQLRQARGTERQVFLSRWIKPVRIVPDSEVAAMYKELLDGTDVEVPDNVVTPSLLNELKKAGVKIKDSGMVKYSLSDGKYADTFYSHMAKVVDGVKQDKLGADSVVNMLRGKGVKAEEIKWSGIESFLEGKKSVTKAELQEFIAANQLQIEEQERPETTRFTKEQISQIREISAKNDSLWKECYDLWEDATGDVFPFEILAADNHLRAMERGVAMSNMPLDRGEKLIRLAEEITENDRKLRDIADKAQKETPTAKWGDYKLEGGDNYRELVFKMPNSDYRNEAMRVHWGNDTEGVLAHARVQDMTAANGQTMLFIEEIQSDWHNAGQKNGYKSARAKETIASEINALEAELERIDSEYKEALAGWDAFTALTNPDAYKSAEALAEKRKKVVEKLGTLYDEGAEVDNMFSKKAPDAPFRDNYHEYVLKRLIRMAAEEGYDSIGWTTADIQSERWSDDYAEGYRIEYDQDIPSFLKKYGKKWGAQVGKTMLDQGMAEANEEYIDQQNEYIADWQAALDDATTDDELSFIRNQIEYHEQEILKAQAKGEMVWSMPITPAMKQSVLYEGQPKYSLSADSDGKQLSKGQQEYFKDSKMRDDSGNLKVMYHGSRYAGFHVFDPAHSDDDTSLFFVDRNDVAASYSGTSETYEAKTIRSTEDMNKFLAEIGYDHYEAVERNGKFELLENNEHVAWSDTAQGLYEEFCWYEGVGEGDANYKVYLNLQNPLVVDAEGRNWNNISREFSQEVYDKYQALTDAEKDALHSLAEWEDIGIFRDELKQAAETGVIGPSGVFNDDYSELLESAYRKMGGKDADLYSLFYAAADNFTEESIKENAIKRLNTRDYAKKAKVEGYDGVIFNNIVDIGGYGGGRTPSTVAIAFDSNQVKSVANENPTGDPDIRYSLSEDSEGRELSPAVKNRFGNSKAVDENGNLKVLYHGTAAGEFSIFDKSKGSVEGDFGSGFYFTDNDSDVSEHYEGGGPDFDNKVARRAEQIEAEEDIDYDEAEERARAELYKGSHKFEVYLNIENPAIVGETTLLDPDSYYSQYNQEDYDSEDDYYGDVEQLVADDIDGIIWDIERNVDIYSTDGIADVLWEAFNEGGIEIETLKTRINDLYLEDGNGNFVGNEVARQIVESLGYDGIIDPTVSTKWNMDIEPGTTHYIVFKPNQIKAVTNQSPTDNPDIHKSLSAEGEAPTKGRFYGKDIRLEVAPIAEDFSDVANTTDTEQAAPEPIAPVAPETVADAPTLLYLYDEQAHLQEQLLATKDEEAAMPLVQRYHEVTDQIRQLEAEEQALQSEYLASLGDADVPPEVEAPYYESYESDHDLIDDPFKKRDIKDVGDRKVKAYMYENPEVKPFFQQEANAMLGELRDTTKGEKWYNDQLYYESGGENGWGGTSRQTTDDIAYLLDELGYSYAEIEKGLKAIVEDNGAENNACSKRIEFILNDRLMKGYDTFGAHVPANQDYINLINEKYIIEYSEEARKQFFEVADQYAPPAEDIAPIAPKATEKVEPIKAEPIKSEPSMKRATEESKTEGKIAKVLTDEPQTERKGKNAWSMFKNHVLDRGMVFEDLSLKTGNRELQARWNTIRYAESKAQKLIGEGNEMVSSLQSIRQTVENSGKTEDFYNYLYHKHNVDRMSLEAKAAPTIGALNAKFGHLTEAQVKAIAAKKITDTTTEKTAQTIREAKEYLNAIETKNKPVFGDDVTADVSKKMVAEYEKANPEFKAWAQDVYGYMNYLREMLVDDGVISNDTARLWAEMYPNYVPIRRAGKDGLSINVPLDTGRTGINAPIKRAEGGNSDILPLFDTMALRTQQTYRAIARNRFGVELKNTLGTTIDNTAQGVDDTIESIDNHDELLQKGKNGAKPTFTVFENGERVTFEISEEMYDAMKPTSKELAYTNKALNTAGNVFRGLLTEYNPVFMTTNAAKDAQDILINSQHPARTYAAIPKAITQMAKGGHYYREYLANGGEQNTYFDGDSKTFKAEDKGWKKVVGMPLRGISYLNNTIERIPRLAEYIASREAGQSIDVSMLDAARVTTNFAAGGDLTKALNRNGFTFLNASTQGAVQQVRNIREAKANGLKGWVQLASKVALAGLPVMLLNSLLWDDDEEYEELSDYVKQNYYVVAKFGDGQFVRIPKGRTVAVIQNALEQVSNALTGDDEADLQSFLELAISNLAPNNPLENNILAPIIQVKENKTWYGEDLVPTRLQDLPSAEQYDESTDSLSRWLGEKTNTSPYKWNYLLNQYSGGVGDVFMPMMTPEAESGDNSLGGNVVAPFKDKFTTDSTMNNQNVSDFYDTVDELTKNAKSANATDEDVLKYKYMNSVQSDLSELYKQKREIQNSDLPDAEKYDAVRDVQKQINSLASESLETYGDVYINDGYATVGDRHYKLKDGEWQKISDEQLEKQNEVVDGLGIDPSEYWANKSEYDFAYEYPEKYAVAKSVGGYEQYKTYSSELYDIKADKDEDGKSITGSRKEKVIDYINNLDADYGEKIILFKSEYKADDTYNEDIIDYLNSREDISYDEMVTILTELGFTVKNGNVYWD